MVSAFPFKSRKHVSQARAGAPLMTTAQAPQTFRLGDVLEAHEAVRGENPDYDGIVVNTVQVFPGVTTRQEMVMIPRGGMPTDQGRTEEFTVPPQGL